MEAKIKTNCDFTIEIKDILSYYYNFVVDMSSKIDKNEFNNCINSLEKVVYDFNKIINDNNNLLATKLVNQIDEKLLIHYYKKLYKSQGIRLRTNRKYPITILTINGEMTIYRYVLRPLKEDYDALYKLEGVTAIIPKDEFLGISVLPTKMTVEAMLLTARKAQELSSYKLAEEVLKNDFGLNVCAATIQNVTNIIGSIAFKNESEKAEEAYDLFNRAKLNFNYNKDGILYIETDGAMFNMREKDANGST
jgi:hypothetical protein